MRFSSSGKRDTASNCSFTSSEGPRSPAPKINSSELIYDTVAKFFDKQPSLTRKQPYYVFKLPFGEAIHTGVRGRAATQGYVTENVRQGFGGYEEDAESGLDYAQARYLSSGQGRFTSVDPLLASGTPVNPKTWNRYVLNKPRLTLLLRQA